MLTHLTRRFLGAFAGGVSLNELISNGVPHHGHFSSGIGGMRVSLARYFSVRRLAVSLARYRPDACSPSGSASPTFLTHRPISNGQSPRLRSLSVCRISSIAQDQCRRPPQLVERQQPQRIPHQDAGSRARDTRIP